MDFGNDVATVPLAVDPEAPEGQNVDPILIPALDATAERLGIFDQFGGTQQAELAEASSEANRRRAETHPPDALAYFLRALRTLNKQVLTVGPFAWTTQDSRVMCELPTDRIPVSGLLERIIPILTDASAVPEALTITDLLPIPFQLTPAQTVNAAIVDDAGVRLGIPFKSQQFTITKHGGGNFTTAGILFLAVREDDLR